MSGRHILHVFPGFGPGGTQMRTVQLMGMLPAGTRHTVLGLDGVYDCMRHVPPGVPVDTLEPPAGRGTWAMGGYMAELIDERAPDAVMTYNWGAIEMVLGARRRRFQPVIHHEDGFGPEEAHRFLRRRIWMRRLLLRGATAVAVPSRTLMELATRVWWQKPEKVHYLPNGVDLERFQPTAPGSRPVTFGHVAHLRAEKNQGLLLRAIAQVPAPARLRIVGDGDQRGALEALAAELGIADRVDFVGAVADTAPEYGQMDAFVLTSDTEQMPLTVLESMACGLPVVSTDVGDVRVMVHESNRELIVPKSSVTGLAAAMIRILESPQDRVAIGHANRAHCETTYDKFACYQAWVDFYGRVLGL